jgi:hypothetical protein
LAEGKQGPLALVALQVQNRGAGRREKPDIMVEIERDVLRRMWVRRGKMQVEQFFGGWFVVSSHGLSGVYLYVRPVGNFYFVQGRQTVMVAKWLSHFTIRRPP